MKKEIINTEIPQYEDTRAWGLYQNGKLTYLSDSFAPAQNQMLIRGDGDCRQVTIVADKTTTSTIITEGAEEPK